MKYVLMMSKTNLLLGQKGRISVRGKSVKRNTAMLRVEADKLQDSASFQVFQRKYKYVVLCTCTTEKEQFDCFSILSGVERESTHL